MRLLGTLLMKEYDLDTSFWDILVELFYNLLYIYSVSIMVSYLTLSFISFIAVRKYLQKNFFVDYKDILNTEFAPSVSILAPAYNEAATIIENVRSILSIHYSNFEVVVINDGSKDETIDLLIEEYDLIQVDFAINDELPTKEIYGVYKSRNDAFNQLVVVDKANGGKSDALNVGINVAKHDYVTCIDVDCVLEQDALLKLMKPFMDENEREVVATGGVIRIANSCVIEDGRLLEVKVPTNFVARSQALEYIRAFLLGRMAWSLMDGLILISGALGVFNRKIAIEVGGYDHNTVGEDMELVVRMRRYMIEKKRKYTVAFIPDPLCWTECPESWSILGRQRNRWTRGTIETLWKHRGMFFNPKYKLLGMLSYPYWFVFEWAAPLLEAFGLMLFFLLALVGLVNWSFFLLMMGLIFGFTVTFSVLSLLIEEITYHNYKRKRDLLALLRTGLIEPFIYHPYIVYAAIMGNLDYLFGKSSWGEMTRKGFSESPKGGPKRIRVVEKATPAPKKVPAVKASVTSWAAGAVAVMAITLYFVVDMDALLTRNELAWNPTLVEAFSPKPKPSETLIKKERALLARSLKIALKSTEASKKEKQIVGEGPSKIKDPDSGARFGEYNESTNTKQKSEDSSAKTPAKAQPETAKQSKKNNESSTKKESIKKSSASKSDYYVIAASYNERELAVKLQRRLANEGFSRAIVVQTDGRYRVAYAMFDSEQRAKDYLFNIRLNVNGESWLLKN